MKFIQGCGAFAAMMIAVSSMLPAQAQTTALYPLSVGCEALTTVKPASDGEKQCKPGPTSDGLSTMVKAGDTVTFTVFGPVTSWSGCTVTVKYPPASICTIKMTGPKSVSNTAPAPKPAASASPGAGGGGGGRAGA